MEFTQLSDFATIGGAVLIGTGLTQVLKQAVRNDRWVPMIAIAIGEGLSFLAFGVSNLSALGGLAIGLMSIGFWSGTAKIVQG